MVSPCQMCAVAERPHPCNRLGSPSGLSLARNFRRVSAAGGAPVRHREDSRARCPKRDPGSDRESRGVNPRELSLGGRRWHYCSSAIPPNPVDAGSDGCLPASETRDNSQPLSPPLLATQSRGPGHSAGAVISPHRKPTVSGTCSVPRAFWLRGLRCPRVRPVPRARWRPRIGLPLLPRAWRSPPESRPR